MDERWRRELAKMMAEYGIGSQFNTITHAPDEQPTLTMDGLLYQIAVFKQDLEEDPVPVAMRGEPGTLAFLRDALRSQEAEGYVRDEPGLSASGPLSLFGVRLEEDHSVPPQQLDLIDHKGRVMQRIEIAR